MVIIELYASAVESVFHLYVRGFRGPQDQIVDISHHNQGKHFEK